MNGFSKNWGESLSIDPWGNLLSITPSKCSAENLQVSVTLANGGSKNQITTSGYQYDAAGNMTLDGQGHAPVYDAENRIKTVAGVNYTYDGDGKRVKKDSGKLYWTGTGADPLDESDLSGTVNEEFIFFNRKRLARLDLPNAAVHYYFSDHLGSASVITNATGSTIEQESDYYPYGGERIISAGLNTYKFTGKERDLETGLDFFGARHYGSSLGRFLSPDEFAGGPVDAFGSAGPAPPGPLPYADVANPQSLNRYTYVYNRPTRYVDPDGHCLEDACVLEAGAVGFAVGGPVGAVIAGGAALAATYLVARWYYSKGNADDNRQTAPPPTASGQTEAKPRDPADLVGKNPSESKARINTDLPGGHDEAKKTFDELTQGQKVQTNPKTGFPTAEDGTQLRLNPDGKARIDRPPAGGRTKTETIHFNPPSPASMYINQGEPTNGQHEGDSRYTIPRKGSYDSK